MIVWEAIPGETPIDDVSGLKIKGLTKRSELNVHEAENIRKVIVKYFAEKLTRRRARFDLSWSKRLHKEMFGDVWTWAGKIRQHDLNIGIPWYQAESGLQALLDDLDCWPQYGVGNLEQAVRLHHRAVQIHPFANGNGRWSRMLANIWLKLHNHPLTDWPEDFIGAKSPIREEYLVAIRLADDGEDGPLLDLHRRFTPLLPR